MVSEEVCAREAVQKSAETAAVRERERRVCMEHYT
jgi:hypothetical protein